MNTEYIRNVIKRDVLVASDVSEMLGVSKQQIINLVKKGTLIPIKETPNGYLFLRDDISKYIEKKLQFNENKIQKIIGDGVTWRSKEYFDNEVKDYEKIHSVHAYFNKTDAIFNGCYLPVGKFQRDTLLGLDAPTFVITYDNGEELWFDGFNCGYNGTGPNGSYHVFEKLGIPDPDVLYYSEWIRCYREGDSWKVISKKRDVYCNDIPEKERKEKSGLGGSLCLFNNKLVLIQNRADRYALDTKPIDFVEKYSYFVPNPVSVTFMAKSVAEETGHYVSSLLDSAYYQIIIEDITGRELWLDYYIDENAPINKQQNLQTILEKLEMEISKEDLEKLCDRAKLWLGIYPRINDMVTCVKKKKK